MAIILAIQGDPKQSTLITAINSESWSLQPVIWFDWY